MVIYCNQKLIEGKQKSYLVQCSNVLCILYSNTDGITVYLGSRHHIKYFTRDCSQYTTFNINASMTRNKVLPFQQSSLMTEKCGASSVTNRNHRPAHNIKGSSLCQILDTKFMEYSIGARASRYHLI